MDLDYPYLWEYLDQRRDDLAMFSKKYRAKFLFIEKKIRKDMDELKEGQKCCPCFGDKAKPKGGEV